MATVSWTDFIVQLVKYGSNPTAAVVIAVLFRRQVAAILTAIEYFVRQRQFKASIPGASVETGAAETQATRIVQEQIEATPPPPASTAEIKECLEARSFILRDKAGRVRAHIGLLTRNDKQYPAIRIFDTEGKVKVALGISSAGTAGLSLYAPNESRMDLVSPPGRDPFIAFTDAGDSTRTVMEAKAIRLENGRAYLGLLPDETTALILSDKSGKEISRVQ
jgi:hypothetical protein